MKKPSVTELIKLLDKPALLSWANKQGLQGVDISLKKKEWLDVGTSIHGQIENYIKHGTPFINPAHQLFFDVFAKDKTFLNIEKEIETEWFTGRYDAMIEMRGCKYIIDYKLNHKTVYLENKLQLIAYGMAESCDKFAIVSIPDFKITEVTIGERDPYEKIIIALSSIYQAKQQINSTI